MSKPLTTLIDEFCARPGIGPKSRTTYADTLTRFRSWTTEQGYAKPEDLVPDVIDAYARYLEVAVTRRGVPLALASRKTYLKSVKQLLGWLEQRHKVGEIDHRAVELPRLRKRHRDVLTREEIQLLEDAATTERDKLMIRLMADTGTREGGIASLRKIDLVERDRRHHYVRVRDKTGERLPPIAGELYRRLKAYADGKTGRPRTSNPFLFISRRRPNGGGDYQPLTESGVYQAVKDAAARCGLVQRIYPHLLKHSAITWMVSKHMHPAIISDITGTSIQVIVDHYSHPTDEQRHAEMMRIMEDLPA